MRRPVLNLFVAALALCSTVSLWAADAPAAASAAQPQASAAPTAITGSAAAPAASTHPSLSMATIAPAAVATPAPAASTTSAAPASAPSTAAAPAPAQAAPAPAAAEMQSAAPAPALQPVAQTRSSDMPQRGMNMANVEHIFGTPLQKYDAVGKPPITRWDYQDYIVYFEYNMVLHTVLKN